VTHVFRILPSGELQSIWSEEAAFGELAVCGTYILIARGGGRGEETIRLHDLDGTLLVATTFSDVVKNMVRA